MITFPDGSSCPWYFGLPWVKGKYLYFIMCWNTHNHNNWKIFRNCYPTLICLFIVIQNKVMKYITNIGQNTGMLKQSKNVQTTPIKVLFVTEYQNLNSGSRLMNGLNSSLALVGNSGPFSSAKSPPLISFQKSALTHHRSPLPDRSSALEMRWRGLNGKCPRRKLRCTIPEIFLFIYFRVECVAAIIVVAARMVTDSDYTNKSLLKQMTWRLIVENSKDKSITDELNSNYW